MGGGGTGGSATGGQGSTTASSGSGGSGGDPCVGEDDATLCLASGAACGTIEVVDGCGVTRHPDCGTCTLPDSCGGGGQPNQCGCTPKTSAQLCNDANAECGTLNTTDGCGQSITTTCGACSGYLSCSANQCTCSAPPDPTSLFCVDSGGPKLNLAAPSGEIALAYAPSGNPTPTSCTSQNSITYQVNGSGVNLPFPVTPNTCGSYRVCSWDPQCSSGYSPGVVFTICVNSVGAPSCAF
ncbi:MAG: hypothetical protein R3B72_26860 [Polyangiaceae bacterium]